MTQLALQHWLSLMQRELVAVGLLNVSASTYTQYVDLNSIR